ncbi:MAG: hypothetical protein K2H28_05480, partial [Ruminococcus sp.]|nr:hypothetical protein [Ruminococcus sp.]
HILIMKRIKFLTKLKNTKNLPEEENIAQRIKLLYTEKSELEEITEHLEKYVERVEKRDKA